MREVRSGVKNLGFLDHVVKRIFNYINIISSAIELVFLIVNKFKKPRIFPPKTSFYFSIFCFNIYSKVSVGRLVTWIHKEITLSRFPSVKTDPETLYLRIRRLDA